MNKRIKELAEQAGMHETHFGYGRSYDNVIWGDYDIEKFAKLIIAECMQCCANIEQAQDLTNYPGGFRDGALLCREEIRERFDQ